MSAFPWLRAIQAAEKGDYTLLDARLGDRDVTLTMEERNFIRSNGFTPVHRSPGPRPRYHVTQTNESLEIARRVILHSKGYLRGQVEGAMEQVAGELGCSLSTVKKHVARAKEFSGGTWWQMRCSMTRKGKGAKAY
jgi:hypothetical protein